MKSSKLSSQQEENSKKETHHHKQLELCMNRPAYRQGRKLTAVKVYTIASESQHLFVYGVPSINLRSELKSLFNKYGDISSIHVVPEQNVEIFTECYHIQYKRIQSARIAKRLIDNKSFYGGVLHVCYAPEYESLDETEAKLEQRRKDVLVRLNKYNAELFKGIEEVPVSTNETIVSETSHKRKHSQSETQPIYTDEDPILCLKKKQKKNTELNIARYASQCSDMNGGVENNMNNQYKKHSKKFIPLPLRYKTNSEEIVYGPQLPKSVENMGELNECSSQNEIASEAIVLEKNNQTTNQINVRKMENNVEKRIIFRNKIQNKIPR